jgi:hypothetical protein
MAAHLAAIPTAIHDQVVHTRAVHRLIFMMTGK